MRMKQQETQCRFLLLTKANQRPDSSVNNFFSSIDKYCVPVLQWLLKTENFHLENFTLLRIYYFSIFNQHFLHSFDRLFHSYFIFTLYCKIYFLLSNNALHPFRTSCDLSPTLSRFSSISLVSFRMHPILKQVLHIQHFI